MPNTTGRLLDLWSAALQDLGSWCCTSTSRDYNTAAVRIKHEGVSFLTITLPAFCKDFEKGLEEGRLAPDMFTGFRKRAGLPLFLGGFLERVFEHGSGRLLDEPEVDCIFAIRQLTLMFGKILLECSDARKAGAISKYFECEQEVKAFDASTTQADLDDLLRVSNVLFRDVFTKVEMDIYRGDIKGRHGPGKTADRLLGNKKFDLKEWPARLEAEFPYWEHGIPNARYLYRYNHVSLLEPGAERPVKVVLVPKTLKTPRVIAIEPTAMQYMQQGIAEKFVDYLESDKTVQGMIGFRRQTPNQRLAKIGSLNGLLATLDLSEASDRVSNQHVRVMLQRFPFLSRAVDATRSRKADVNGKVVRLAKYASMGSALCFPMEAMVFLSLVFLGIERESNRQITREKINALSGQVRVYGDDIVVPVRYVRSVISTLESFGFRVNAGKSFWNGKFRESCGKEYYNGHDVSITRVRRVLPVSRLDVQEIVSTVSLRNQLYYAGMWRTAAHLDGIVGRLLDHYPVLDPSPDSFDQYGRWESSSPLLGMHSFLGSRYLRKWDYDLQIPLVRGYQVVSDPPASEASGEGALLKWFLKRGEQPFADRDHLVRQGRPQTVNIKLRWNRPV